jgi:hypothetical protein
MIENSGEIKEVSNSRVTELGQVFFDGKHENIKLMDEFGLPIPDTLIVGIGIDNQKYEEWINEHKGQDIIIRTSNSRDRRNSTSFRDPERSEISIDNIQNFVNLDQAVILQALPEGSIDHDCLSGICRMSTKDNEYGLHWEINCNPDLATLTNRLGLSSWWKFKLRNQEVLYTEVPKGNREVLLNHIYYRVGRTLLKSEGIKLPNLESVEYGGEQWKQAIEYCKENIHKLEKDHALVILQEKINKYGIESVVPDEKDIELLKKIFPKITGFFRKQLNRSEENTFPFSFGVKFSILEYEGKEKQLLCWDIIKGA